MLSDQRLRGRRAILDTIRQAGQVARIDIAERTGISQATVTTITAELLREGLIEEVTRSAEPGEGRRGRPRVDLTLRGPAHLVAGVKLAVRTISAVVVDFKGNLLSEFSAPLPVHTTDPKQVALAVRDAISGAAAAAGHGLSDLSGAALGLPGVIDAEQGLVRWSPSLSERNVYFARIVTETLGIPACIDNDANLVAMAEQYFGHGVGVRNFIVVTVEAGVGMGVVLDGKLYRGARGCGAEFGHSKVHLEGALCRCGQRGCLEAYVADYAVMREAALADLEVTSDGSEPGVEAVVRAAEAGNPVARSILERASRMFAMGLANLVNVLDPSLIILSGERMQVDHLYADEVVTRMREQIVQVDAPPPRVIIHKWGDSMWARGAAAFALSMVAERSLKELGNDAAV